MLISNINKKEDKFVKATSKGLVVCIEYKETYGQMRLTEDY